MAAHHCSICTYLFFLVTYFFVLFEALHPSQQFLVMSGCFPGLKMKSLAQGHNTVPQVRFEPTTLQLRDPQSNHLSKLTILPISWVSRDVFEGGKGANVLPLFYRRGQMSTIIHLLRGQMSSPVNHLGGRCPHIPFFTGGQMSEGANVRLPFAFDCLSV